MARRAGAADGAAGARLIYNATMRKLVLVAVGLAGCSNNLTSDQACHDLSSAICAKLQTCSPILISGGYGDVATCTKRFQIGCLAGLNAPRTTSTPSFTEGCAQAIVAGGCDLLFARTMPSACVAVAGPLTDGMACGDDGQCSSTYCRKPPGMTCGTCGPRGAAGATCARDEDCQARLKCDQQKCVTLVAAGSACDATHGCTAPAMCVNSTCVTPGLAGAMCDATHPCDLTQALFCINKACAAATFTAPGMACGLVNNAAVGCAGGSVCLGDVGQKVCSAVAADGTSCDAAKGPTCVAPAECVSGVCKLPNPAACQ
jgi:hypothetical protein